MLKKIAAVVIAVAVMFGTAVQPETVYAGQCSMDVTDREQKLSSNRMHLNEADDIGKRVVSLSLGDMHSGAVTEDGSLYMWGSDNFGQLGDNTVTGQNRLTPVKVLDHVKSISLGDMHSGAVTKNRELYMWGVTDYGHAADKLTEKSTPKKILENIESVSAGHLNSGAVTEDGVLYMWGDNNGDGKLGDGTTESRDTPVKVMDNVRMASLGVNHSGAVTKDGSLYMWGSNFYGELGDGTTESRDIPVKVMDNVELVSLGDGHSGAVTKDGSLYMWGSNSYGELGDGTMENRDIPVKVMDNVELVSLGDGHSGAVDKDGNLYMWGHNNVGELGDGTTENRNTPVKVLDHVELVSLGGGHSGAVDKDGNLYMWGHNLGGEIGDGTRKMRLSPVKIDLFSTQTVSEKASQKITYHSSAIQKGKKVTYGSSFSLNAKTSGTGKLTYKSSNTKILTVDPKGRVKVKGYGPATLTIKASASGGYKAAGKKIRLTAVPRQGEITKAEMKKEGAYFTWKPEKTADGYEYAVAYNKKFTGQTRRKTGKTGLLLTKYKTNTKKMYVRVRVYKKVGKKTYYGSWSEPQLLKLKKNKKSGQSAYKTANE